MFIKPFELYMKLDDAMYDSSLNLKWVGIGV